MKWLRMLGMSLFILAILYLASAILIVTDGLQDELHVVDVGIVLGTQVYRDGSPSDRLRARLDEAVLLYRRGFLKSIIVSGGRGDNGIDEATAMARYLREQGIPAGEIYVDSEGANTYLTARNSSRIMREKGLHSAMVISQYFHISRSRLALRRFGIDPVYGAHARFFELRDFYSTGREVAGFLVYWLRSYS